MAAPNGPPTGLSGSAAPPVDVKVIEVPCNGRQPPALAMSR